MNTRANNADRRLSGSRVRCTPFLLFLLVIPVCLSQQACGDDNGTPPLETVRFGQLGEVEVGVVAPLLFGEGVGELQQILTWGSSGAWVLREIISYRGLLGDETVIQSKGDPVAYASAYASSDYPIERDRRGGTHHDQP